MNGLQVFANPDFGEIRTVEIDGEPWLVGKDVAVALGYSNPRKALADHVDNEDKNTVTIRDGIPGNPNVTVINESGLYSLILSSKLPSAKKFKRWVTLEVLPAIRRTGGYHTPVSEAELLARLAQANWAQEQRISALERKIDVFSLPDPEENSVCPSQDKDGPFLSSLEIAGIFGWKHNQVLRRIRSVLKHAEIDGVSVQGHIRPAYRRDANNARQMYYQLDLSGVRLFGQSIRDKSRVENLEKSWKMLQEVIR